MIIYWYISSNDYLTMKKNPEKEERKKTIAAADHEETNYTLLLLPHYLHWLSVDQPDYCA